MDQGKHITTTTESQITEIDVQLEQLLEGGKRKQFMRFVLAALSSIPWVGGLIGAGAALSSEIDQGKVSGLQHEWLREHEKKIKKLAQTLFAIFTRLNSLGPETEKRAESDEYLALVRKGFVIWDQADTDDKRELVKKLLVNAAGTKLSDDDVVRLFLDWIERYHEAHFSIIRAVYKNHAITRLGIWKSMGKIGPIPRENSSDADLFRMLIDDLSQGRVIRQERDVNHLGQFIKKPTGRPKRNNQVVSDVMKSSFDDTIKYELSELGSEFVHYVLDDTVARIKAN